jgi:hypothetical protein
LLQRIKQDGDDAGPQHRAKQGLHDPAEQNSDKQKCEKKGTLGQAALRLQIRASF